MINLITTSLFILMLFFSPIIKAELVEINNQQLEQLVENKVTIIDVRRADEWIQTGVIDQSHLMTFFDQKGQYDANAWLMEFSEVAPKNSPVVLICHSGSRSRIIADWLNNTMGYAKVYNVTRGIDSWIKSGRSTEKFKEKQK